MPVAAFGCPVDADGWDAFNQDTGIPVIIDAAGAFGNQPIGRRCPAVFSLHATKSLGVGEGGFVATTDAEFAECLRRMSVFGIDMNSGYSLIPGTNAKLSEDHAAVGLAALVRWQNHRVRRIALMNEYAAQVMSECAGLALQHRPLDGDYTIFPVCLPRGCDIEGIRRILAEVGIETRRWYVPLVCDHPSLAGGKRVGSLAVCELLRDRLLGLPLHIDLSRYERLRVCTELAAVLRPDKASIRLGNREIRAA